MAGSLALFSVIKAQLEPEDKIGHQWLEAQKQQWEFDQRPLYRKPFAIAGTIVMLLIIMGGGFGLRSRRRKRDEQEEDEDNRRNVKEENKDDEEV